MLQQSSHLSKKIKIAIEVSMETNKTLGNTYKTKTFFFNSKGCNTMFFMCFPFVISWFLSPYVGFITQLKKILNGYRHTENMKWILWYVNSTEGIPTPHPLPHPPNIHLPTTHPPSHPATHPPPHPLGLCLSSPPNQFGLYLPPPTYSADTYRPIENLLIA